MIGLFIATALTGHAENLGIEYFETFKPGLGLLLAANAIFAIILLISRSWYAIIPIITLALSYHSLPSYIQLRNSPPEASSDATVVCLQSFNVHQCKTDKKRNTIDHILHIALRNKVQILCMQEFQPRNEARPYKDYFPYCCHTDSITRTGVAIYSAYPIVAHRSILFPQVEQASAVIADIDIEGHIVRVISAHLQTTGITSNRREIAKLKDSSLMTREAGESISKLEDLLVGNSLLRHQQADILADEVAQSPFPVILCGDFNETPTSYSNRIFSSLLTDAFQSAGSGIAYSFASPLLLIRLDYIFHSKEIIPHEFYYQSDICSDHRASFLRMTIEQ